jgi:hypothetical protein
MGPASSIIQTRLLLLGDSETVTPVPPEGLTVDSTDITVDSTLVTSDET